MEMLTVLQEIIFQCFFSYSRNYPDEVFLWESFTAAVCVRDWFVRLSKDKKNAKEILDRSNFVVSGSSKRQKMYEIIYNMYI